MDKQSETKTENLGLIKWEAMRAEWLRPKPQNNNNKKTSSNKSKQEREVINAEDIAERIFSQNGNWQLSEPIPLNEMVDILIDFWQDEGLYD
jgi:hypothetical protein